jgi:tRNA A-37 threonylcarbamoyl transferase component Bud32
MNETLLYHKIRKDEIEWIVLDEYFSVIPGELVEKVGDVASYPECCVIRENNVRISLFLSLPERREVIFVKRYKCRGFRDIITYFFFTSKASSEWRNINRFLQKGIPVALPLAKGEKRRFNCLLDSYLVTKAFVNAMPLHRYVDYCLKDGKTSDILERRKMLNKKLALLVKKIHNAGFFYRDLHAGNILVVEGDDGKPQLYLVDLHRVKYLKRVPIWMRIKDLAQLRNSIAASRTDRMRFLHEYAKGSPLFSIHFKVNARRIEAKAKKLWKTHLKSRTKRCVVNSSEFVVKKDRAQSVYYNRSYSERFLTEVIEEYHKASATGRLTVLKRTSKETVSMITSTHNGKRLKILVKESRFPRLLSKLRYTFCKSRTKKYWIAARGLKVRGIETPGTLALIEKKNLGIAKWNILLTEFIDQAFELNDYVRNNFKKALSRKEMHKKEQFLKEFAKKLRCLHERGIYHADLKSNNILVKERNGNEWMFYFIDLDRVTFKHSLSFDQRSNNLAQINASIADCITLSERLKFFRAYAWGTSVMRDKKRYYQRVLEISRKKITRPYGIVFSPPAKEIH